MSQIVLSEELSSISLGQRISEIMEEKGAAFSIRAFSQRLFMSKDTLARIIQGERTITPSELESIAKGLNVSVERIRRNDTAKKREELLRLLKTKYDPRRALVLARECVAVALGVTERCEAGNSLARAYFALGMYEQAHGVWLGAYELSQEIYQQYGTTDRLYNILSNLMISYTIRKEYSHLAEILQEIEPVFQEQPNKLGAICYSKAMIAEQAGNKDQAKLHLYQSLDHFQVTGDLNDIGRAELNVGYFEFKSKNYETAKKLLEHAIEKLQDDIGILLIAIKAYIQILFKLGEHERANQLLDGYFQQTEEYPEVRAKFCLLRAIANQDEQSAKEVFMIPNAGQRLHYLACEFLVNRYMEVGDLKSARNYYKKAQSYSDTESDPMHKEGL
jgi:tetratricopeptide (TPR) repeat protein